MASIVAMALGEVTPDHVSERGAYVSSQSLQPPFVREHASGRFGADVVFGAENAIKTTVRESGAFHDVRDANSVEAALAKKRARYLQNLLAMGRGLLAGHSHGCLLSNPLDTIHDCCHKYHLHDGNHQNDRMMITP